jgi:hypothetical protein
MSRITCDQIRTAALDPASRSGDWTRLPDVAAHIRRCVACQDWLDAFTAGEQAWASMPGDDFTEQVILRTSGVEAVLSDLALLAEMDPGPGFTARVLLATSRKAAPQGWRARASGAWRDLVRRPRFAWEAAYLATVCWVLVFGNPVGAIEWSAANIGTVARERLSAPVRELRGDLETWRAGLARDAVLTQGAAAGQGAEPTPAVVRAWQSAASWLRGIAASVAEAFAAAWDGVAAWMERLAGEPSSPSTEPPAGPARSHQ